MTTQQETAPGGQEQPAPGGQEQSQEQQPPAEPQVGSEQEKQPKTYDEAYVTELRRSEANTRTKLRATEKERDTLKTANLSADEKVVADAEQRGRSAAATDFGKRLARTEFDALAGRRNPEAKTAELLEFVDLAKFVGDDGEPDMNAIKSAVERLVPESDNKPPPPPNFEGGQRPPPAPGTDFSGEIRKKLGR